MWDKKLKDVNLIEPDHEPSQAKLELGSFTNRAELARLQPSQFRAELFSNFFRANFERTASREFFEQP